MLRLPYLIVGMIVFFPILALACPSVEVDKSERDRLFEGLRNAQTEMQGRAVSDQLWHIWTTAPDTQAQSMLDLGRERIRYGDYEGAEMVLSELIAYCPTYSEGWNQRAFARFLRQDYGRALDDIAEVLEREPRHFGALSGRATILINMGRTEVGYLALREALKVNPWLSERHMLPQGDDL